jgi:hypothetical protein
VAPKAVLFLGKCGGFKKTRVGDPKFLPAKILLSHVFLKEGKDWDAAEKALREVLAQDPNNVETMKTWRSC